MREVLMIIIGILTYIFNVIDLFLTKHIVLKYGISCEANPLGRFLLKFNLVTFYKLYLVFIMIFTLTYLAHDGVPLAITGLITCFVLYILLTLYHIILFIICK